MTVIEKKFNNTREIVLFEMALSRGLQSMKIDENNGIKPECLIPVCFDDTFFHAKYINIKLKNDFKLVLTEIIDISEDEFLQSACIYYKK